MNRIGLLAMAGALLVGSTAAGAASTLRIDLSKCTNTTADYGQPKGTVKGNGRSPLSLQKFFLIDPSRRPNLWVGTARSWIEIKLDTTGVVAVYTLLNTWYGEDGVTNAVVVLRGSGGARDTIRLIGDKRIRDYNNASWTNSINNSTTQRWWLSEPTLGNRSSRRFDVQKYRPAIAGQALSRIEIHAPTGAGPGSMEPMLSAVNVDYVGTAGPKPVCVRHDPG